ncbi:MAG: cytidine deaminase [Clostridia bacterium]|nr:cytidine deaminase [Clostridia bacterium]
MERPDKINYYLDIAETVSKRSTCLRKQYGAIIVKNDIIISTGYNGAPRGRKNCTDMNYCMRDALNIPRGERYEMCRSVHAEANAIIAADRDKMLESTLYMACKDPKTGKTVGGVCSCMMCKRLVLNAGIKDVIVRENDQGDFTIYHVADWIENDDSLTGKFGY